MPRIHCGFPATLLKIPSHSRQGYLTRQSCGMIVPYARFRSCSLPNQFVGDRGAVFKHSKKWERIMKMMKWALLGSAAFAVTATAAQADDLSALKAEIEA